MAYQNGYHQGYPATRAYPATQNHPGQTHSYPAYPGYPGDQQGAWPDQGPPPPPPPEPRSRRNAPVAVHIVAVMQYVTGVVLLLATGVIGVVTFNDGRIGDTELPS